MKRLGDDITHVFLPSNRSECNYEQLRHLKAYELNEDGTPSVAEWLQIACDAELANELIATYNPEILAESLDDCFQVCIGSEVSFLEFPIKSRYLSNTEQIKYPAMAFTNICFGQFVQADEQLMLLTLTKNVKHLWKLCGIFCRPIGEKNYTGVTDEWINTFKRTHDLVDAWLVLDFFLNTRDLMQKRFRHLFSKVISTEEKTELTFQDVRAQREAYDRKIVQYAERPSEKEKQFQTNVWTVLEFIENDIVTAKTLKEQQVKWEKSQRTKGTLKK